MDLFDKITPHPQADAEGRPAAPTCSECGFLPSDHRGQHCPGGDDGDSYTPPDEQAPRSGPLARFIARALPLLPLLVVTGFAGYGQSRFGFSEYSPIDWPVEQRLAIAIGVAVGIEAIALYVAWHAHDALLMRATATAARLRRASYAIALAVAAINYTHFAGPHWSPTPAAVVFATFSAAGPWLWGLHTRRAQRVQLTREGQIDASGATFSAERWRAFPLRTWAARRWSIDHSIDDPRAAWEGYRADRAAGRRPSRLAPLVDALVGRFAATQPADERTTQATADEPGDDTFALPDRRGSVDTESLTAICDDLQAIAVEARRPLTQDEVRTVYGIGAEKAGKARRLLGWWPRAVDQSTEAVAGV